MKSFLQLCGEDARILMSYRARADFESQFFEDAARHFTITEIARVTREDAWFEFRDVCGADVVVYEMRRRRVGGDAAVSALETNAPLSSTLAHVPQPSSSFDVTDEPTVLKKSRVIDSAKE